MEYVGFFIMEDGVRPSNETLSAIKNFPRPTDIMGIRSWFDLVEQVAFSFSKSKLMEPFRPLLKPKAEYIWTDDLQLAFVTARQEIFKLVQQGVRAFTLGLWTCLVTDWSRTGISFVLAKTLRLHPYPPIMLPRRMGHGDMWCQGLHCS